MTPAAVSSRRSFLKAGGALVVGFSMNGPSVLAQVLGGPAAGSPPLGQVDSWLAIAADGSVTAFSGKEELGQGISAAAKIYVRGSEGSRPIIETSRQSPGGKPRPRPGIGGATPALRS